MYDNFDPQLLHAHHVDRFHRLSPRRRFGVPSDHFGELLGREADR